jgi:putative tricarboxylic transport membrane protein
MNNTRLDRISGFAFATIGALVAAGAWAMPRFENLGAKAYEAPGLAPGLLGCALSICGLVMVLRPAATSDTEDFSYWNKIAGEPANRKRAIAALLLTLAYGAVLFGSIPYVIATTGFVFAFIAVFEIFLRPSGSSAKKRTVSHILIAAGLISLIVGFGTHYVFQTLFLVQLP